MKKPLLLLITLVVLSSCDKDVPDVSVPKGKPDYKAMIHIRGEIKAPRKNGARVSSDVISPLSVVKEAVNIKFTTNWFDNKYSSSPVLASRVINDNLQRDTVTPAILMYSTDIVNHFSISGVTFIKDFIYSRSVVFTDSNNDTIAYVPDSVISSARVLIEAAYNDSNYVEVYRLFNDAFTFRTGKHQ